MDGSLTRYVSKIPTLNDHSAHPAQRGHFLARRRLNKPCQIFFAVTHLYICLGFRPQFERLKWRTCTPTLRVFDQADELLVESDVRFHISAVTTTGNL
jgi:hypothetical protein